MTTDSVRLCDMTSAHSERKISAALPRLSALAVRIIVTNIAFAKMFG